MPSLPPLRSALGRLVLCFGLVLISFLSSSCDLTQDGALGTLNLTPVNPVFKPGVIHQFKATITVNDGRVIDGTNSLWSSSNPDVASVDSTGLVTTHKPGSTTISAVYVLQVGPAPIQTSGSTRVTVTEGEVTGLEITPEEVTIGRDTIHQLTVWASFTDGSKVDVSGAASWGGTEPDVAQFLTERPGTVLGIRAGRTRVSAEFQGVTANGFVNVLDVLSVSIIPPEATVDIEEKIRYTSRANLSDGSSQDVTRQTAWGEKSSFVHFMETRLDTELRPLADMVVVRGRNAGGVRLDSAIVPGTYGRYLDGRAVVGYTTLTVKQPRTATKLEITPIGATAANGASLQFNAIATYSDGTTSDVTYNTATRWRSSRAEVVEISVVGLAKAKQAGSTTITASYRNLTAQTGLTIDPPEITFTSLTLEPETALSAPGTKRQYRAIATRPDGSTQDVTAQVDWGSDHNKVVVANDGPPFSTKGLASIDPSAASGESADITATLGGLSAGATLHVGAFAYVVNHVDGNVASFAIEPDGTLSGGDLTDAGSGPSYIAVDPTGRFAYVTNEYDDSVSMFHIDPANGALSGGTTVNAGDGPVAITITLDGRFAYVANFNSINISAFEIDRDDGSLRAVATVATTDSGQKRPTALAVDPTGRFLYSANSYGDTLSIFDINAETGAPTLKEEMESDTWPFSLVLDPTGRFLYVTYSGSSEVAAFETHLVTGGLTEVARKSVGGTPLSIALDITGSFAYVSSVAEGTISRFSIDTDGSLSDRVIAADSVYDAFRVVTDPSGRFVYVVYYSGIAAFSRNSTTGDLTPIGTPISAGGGADAMAVTP